MAKQSAKARAKTRAANRNAATRARRQRSGRLMWIAIVVVVVLGLALAIAARSGSAGAAPRSPAPEALVAQVTSVPPSVWANVGAGSATSVPKPIDAPALTKDAKPLVLYVGAEYCPYCAAERWAVVNALSRFGTLSGLSVTHSSTVDVFPRTNTFSFYGAAVASKYIAFEAVELNTNQIAGSGGYKQLETPTPAQQQLMDTYDAQPYVSAAAANGIPFIDFGGKYISEGATYDPAVLQGKSADEIATSLSDPASPISQGVIGAANAMTAAICNLTHNQPASTCANPMIRGLQDRIG